MNGYQGQSDVAEVDKGQKKNMKLSIYNYKPTAEERDSFAVGWLTENSTFETEYVPKKALHRLEYLSRMKFNRTRGIATCPICQETFIEKKFCDILGSAEVKIITKEVAFSAPDLIVHFIKEHNYKPPDIFVSTINEMLDPLSDSGREALIEFGASFNAIEAPSGYDW